MGSLGVLLKAISSLNIWRKNFFSELKKVVWSTPKQVAKNTVIVIACVLIVGVFIWLFDLVAETGILALKDAVKNAFK